MIIMQKLYYGGDIITMVSKSDAPEALLTEDGRIRFVGDLEKARALCSEKARMVDLNGRALLPSFIDGHSHISMYSQFSSFPDVSGCTSFDEIITFLKAYLREHPMTEGDVLFVAGYDHNFLREEAHPTRKELDAVSDRIPVFLYHSSGHMGVANTSMLLLAGLSDETKDPKGGRYGRDGEGRLTGYLEELTAVGPVIKKAFERLHLDPVQQMKQVQDIYLKYGVTTVQDGATGRGVLEGFFAMAEQKIFRVDVVSYIMADEKPQEIISEHPEYVSAYQNRLRIGGAKILLDGSPQGRSAWLTKPYEGEETYRGYPAHEDAVVLAAAKDAVSYGYQLLAHANGDAAADQYIRCYKAALEEAGDGKDLRPVMIHCQTVRDDELAEMKEIGMIPSIFAAHTYYWGDVHLKNLGKERAERISPVKSALRLGLKYNFHQDCPVLPPDMMQTVWCVVNRVTRKGVKIGEEQCINVFDALKGITVNAAYAYHEEDRKGTLKAGKLADMVILEKNPLTADPMELKDIAVVRTIKEGETLYRKQ